MKALEKIGRVCAGRPALERTVAWLGHHYPQPRVVKSLCYHTGEQAFRSACRRGDKVDRVALLRGRGGAGMVGPLSDHMFRQIYFFGFYEPEITAVVEHLAGPGQTWLDVGANIGYFTFLLSTHVGSTGKVHAFEPNPATADFLARSIRLNAAGNVTLVRAAVSSRSEEATLHVPLDEISVEGGSGRCSLLPQRDIAQLREVSVPALALDDYLAETGTRVDFIKIDIEGLEMLAFMGMERTLRECPPKVILCEANQRVDCVATPQELIAHMARFGYLPYRIREGGLLTYRPGDDLDPILDANPAFTHASARALVEPLLITP